MHPHPYECFICGADEEWTLLVCRQHAKESQVCVRCLHSLIHGLSPEEIRRTAAGQHHPHLAELP